MHKNEKNSSVAILPNTTNIWPLYSCQAPLGKSAGELFAVNLDAMQSKQ